MIVVKGTHENYLDYMALKSLLAKHEGQFNPLFNWTEDQQASQIVAAQALSDLDREDAAVYLAYDKARPVGFLSFALGSYLGAWDKAGVIKGAYVLEDYRHKATPKLWDKAKAWFTLRGIDRVQFECVEGNTSMDSFIQHRAIVLGHVYQMGLNHGLRIRGRPRTANKTFERTDQSGVRGQ